MTAALAAVSRNAIPMFIILDCSFTRGLLEGFDFGAAGLRQRARENRSLRGSPSSNSFVPCRDGDRNVTQDTTRACRAESERAPPCVRTPGAQHRRAENWPKVKRRIAMRMVRLKQVGLCASVAIGAGFGCSESGTDATTSKTSTLPTPAAPSFESIVRQTNLVADQAGFARKTDPDLLNVWGIAFKDDSIWITANHSGDDRQYSEDGKRGEVITLVRNDGTQSSPTGQVRNLFPHAFNGDTFLAASEDGDIFGVNPGTPTAVIEVNHEDAAVYKGAAIATFHGMPRLFATDFGNHKIDAFNADFSPATLGGDFVDPQLATLTVTVTRDNMTFVEMYSPFNVLAVGDGRLLVSYALLAAPDNTDDDAGPHRGFVDIFDTDGNYLQRLISGGELNSPWGMAISQEQFGDFDLIVGNFGDGNINVYGLSAHGPRVHADFEGKLGDGKGNPIVISGLWGIALGSGRGGFGADDLYFAAGPANGGTVEDHGLYGELDFGRRR
jgi:uncharacterized protein (TIGR03118 family)